MSELDAEVMAINEVLNGVTEMCIMWNTLLTPRQDGKTRFSLQLLFQAMQT